MSRTSRLQLALTLLSATSTHDLQSVDPRAERRILLGSREARIRHRVNNGITEREVRDEHALIGSRPDNSLRGSNGTIVHLGLREQVGDGRARRSRCTLLIYVAPQLGPRQAREGGRGRRHGVRITSGDGARSA